MVINGRVKGRLINVSVNSAPLQCEVNSDFSYTIEMIPATNPNGGSWRSYVPGYQTWSINVDGHLLLQSLGADFKTLVESAKNKERLFVRFGSMEDVEPRYAIEGWCYITSLGLGAGTSDFASWNVSFQGDGEFNTDWDEFGLILDANPAPTEWPLIYDSNE